MSSLLVLSCWLLALSAAAPSTRLNVQLDPARPTQLYQAPSGDGRPGAWIITASGPRRPTRRPAATGADAGTPGPGPAAQIGPGGAAVRRPSKPTPSAGAGNSDWTQHNKVEAHAGVGKKPVKLPSFVVTSRPFGFQGSSSSGQVKRRPGAHSSTSGQSHTTSGQGQKRPPISSYSRPTNPRPWSQQSSSDSFIFSSGPNGRPSSGPHRPTSSPSSTFPGRPSNAASYGRPSPARPVVSSQVNHRPSSASDVSSPSQTGSEVSSPPGVSHADLSSADGGTQPADVEPLAAPPSAGAATVTRKTAPDAVSTIGGQKLQTFNLGCRQGRRCSFIINAPTHVPQPTYTPYNKQAVDSYLQRFQTLLALSNARKSSTGSTASSNASTGSTLAPASSNIVSVVVAPDSAAASTGATTDIYTADHATAVPSPGEAYRQDIRRSSLSSSKPKATSPESVEPGTSSAVLVAQRYRPGTADLYRIMRSSPSFLRTIRPAETTLTAGQSEPQWSRGSPISNREAKNVPDDDLSSDGIQRGERNGRRHVPGQKYSRYTVERVDPKTRASYPTPWNSENHESSNVVPVTGTIFKAHLSSGPISFRPQAGVKQSRSEGSFKHFSSGNSNPKTASIITTDGVREFPNVISRDFMHRTAAARHYQPAGRLGGRRRLQMARETRHYAAPLSRSGYAWRRNLPTINPRKLHK